MLPSGHWDGVGTPESGFRCSMTRPTSPSVNASPASSRAPTHDSRSPWIATPSMQDVLLSLLQAGLSRRSPAASPAPGPPRPPPAPGHVPGQSSASRSHPTSTTSPGDLFHTNPDPLKLSYG